MRKVLIVGLHPIRDDLEKQFNLLNCSVKLCDKYSQVESADVQLYDELVLLTNPDDKNAIAQDNEVIAWLYSLSQKLYSINLIRRPVLHLLLQSQTVLRMLQTMDLPQEINDVFDVYPMTMEDVWAKNILVHLPGIQNMGYPSLDWKPILEDSTDRIHLVISGFDKQAEAVAIHAALISHFPNYHPTDQIPLRTRITIVDKNIHERRDVFVNEYQNLFNNSYYRTVDINASKIDFHHPVYEGKRMDFVDVEWEFVNASINSPVMVEKINQWIQSGNQLLTFVVTHGDDEQNLAEALALPNEIYERQLPVFVKQRKKVLSELLEVSSKYNHVYPFGMEDCGYDVSMPLAKLAKYLKYFYDCSYGEIGVPTELPIAEVEAAWRQVKSFKLRFSNIYNVMTIATKMRSVGHTDEDAGAFYALTQKEIETLSEVEHNRWSVERLIQGSRPCNDAESAEIRADLKLKKKYKKKDVHFDLRAYDELEFDETGKNVKVYDYDLIACIPLIVKSFYEDNKHE